MKKPRIIKSQIHMRHLLDRLCIYPLQHDPTSLTLSTVWHNLPVICYQNIGQRSKEFFGTLKERKIILSRMVDQEKLNQDLNIFCDADWAADANRKSVMLLPSQGEPWHGHQRNKQPWHFPQQNPNIFLQRTLPNKYFGTDHYLRN